MTTPLDSLLSVDDEIRNIIELCDSINDRIDKNVESLEDVGYNMRYTYVRKTVSCMKTLCELELKKNTECRSLRGDKGACIGT